jgi:hypothetical protein
MANIPVPMIPSANNWAKEFPELAVGPDPGQIGFAFFEVTARVSSCMVSICIC